MKKHLLIYISILIGYSNLVQAQSTFKFPENYPNAFTEYLYDANEVKVLTETYATNVPKLSYPTNVNNQKENLLLDIYYADNPSINLGLRPIIFFSPGGGMEKSSYKFFGDDLARRGFVVVSINVRGNTLQQLQLAFNSKKINPVQVMTAAMDLHMAINYIISQRANALKVDPNNIIVAGGSFGGAISMQGTFMSKDEANEKFGKDVNNAYFNNYDSKLQTNNIKGVIDLYGPMYDVNFIKPSENNKPVFLYHGSIDPAAPYNEGNLFYIPLQPYMYGSVKIVEKLKQNNNSFYFVTAKDVGHSVTPQCNYDVKTFPNGYPQNWYPDMLYFIKNAILGNKTMSVYKTIDCIEPECSLSKYSCRTASDDANNASRKASNSTNVIPSPNFNNSIADKLPNIFKNSNNKSTTNNNTNNTNSSEVKTESINHCKAFAFDGDDFMKFNNSPSIAVGFEVEFWFKQTASNPDNNIQILYSISNSNNIRNSSFTVGLLGNSQVYLGYFNGANYVENTQTILDAQNKTYTLDNNWHHIHFKVYNGNLTGEIDGNKATFAMQNAIKTSVNTNNNSITYFGGADFNTGIVSKNYKNTVGQMHEIRVWMPNTYSQNYINNTVSSSANGLVLYWKLDENNQTIIDAAPYKINGTLGSNNSVEKSDPVFVNNCDGSEAKTSTTLPSTTTTNDNVLPPVVTSPTVENDGFKISKPSKKPIINFNSKKGGNAVVKIVNSANKVLLTKNVTFTAGENVLSDYIQSFKTGTYTIKVTLNSKSYSQKFTILK